MQINFNNQSFWPPIENTLSLIWLFTNEELAFKFALSSNLIYDHMVCENCNLFMLIKADSSKNFGNKWICPHCCKTKSILYGSIFYLSKIPLCKILHLLYCWAYQYSCKDSAREVGVSQNTVTYYFTLFRNACDAYVLSLDGFVVGGQGKTVQIDETLMCRRKYNVGRMMKQVWIFGGICVEDRRFFCLVVPDRTRETLEAEIRKHVLPETRIVSDCWKAYTFLDDESDYEHQTVNHSHNFVDPETKANTQMFERLWRELKRINKRYEGIPVNKVNEHISEFMWRCNAIEDENRKFLYAIKLIADTKFTRISDCSDEEEE